MVDYSCQACRTKQSWEEEDTGMPGGGGGEGGGGGASEGSPSNLKLWAPLTTTHTEQNLNTQTLPLHGTIPLFVKKRKKI